MDEDKNPSEPKTGKDRWIKIGFVLVIIAAAIAIYSFQRRPLSIDGWGNDLDQALKQGKQDNRMVVAFFVREPPSETARTIAKRMIPRPDNVKALEEGKFISVIVSLEEGKSAEIAEKYKIVKLPTLIVFRPTGKERNRHEGLIGEVDFRQTFLTGKDTSK